MIEVTATQTKDSFRLSLKGHAGYAEAGHDIVCASASILAYTFAETAENMHVFGKLKNFPKILLKSGLGGVTLIPKDLYYEEAEQKFSVICTGFKLLSQNYPQFVKFNMATGN